jgi:hypothetical protein
MSFLTLSQLRQFKGFENISEDEGLSIIDALYTFSILAFRSIYSNHIKQ